MNLKYTKFEPMSDLKNIDTENEIFSFPSRTFAMMRN